MPLPKGRPNRKQMIASALSIARKKRADGGSVNSRQLQGMDPNGPPVTVDNRNGPPRPPTPPAPPPGWLDRMLMNKQLEQFYQQDQARQGRADGGDVPSFPDMVAQNPRGWGTAPPPMPEPTPGQIQAAREFLRQRDAVGNPDADLADVGDKIGQFGYEMTGIPSAQRAGQDFARGRYLQGAGNAALAVAPFVGAPAVGDVVSGLATAAKYTAKGATKAIPAATALLGASAFPAPAGESNADTVRALNDQKADLLRQRADAVARQNANRPASLKGSNEKTDPNYWTAVHDANALDPKIDSIDKQIESHSDEHGLKMREAQQASDDAAAKAELDMPFASRHPYLAPALPFLGTAAAALTSRYGLSKIAGKGDELMGAFGAAEKAGDTLKMSDIANQLDSWKRWAPVKQAAAIGVPATFPMDTRVAGDVIDRYGLPPDSKAQQAAAQRTSVSNFPQYLKDNTLPIMSGIAGSLGGMKLAPAAPVADARALAARYAGKTPTEIGQIVGEGANASIAAQGSLARLAQAQKARKLLGDGDDEAARRLGAPGDVPALVGRGFSTPSPVLQGGQLQATPAPRLAQPTNPALPPPRSLGPTFRGAPAAPLPPPPETASKAMPPVPAPLPMPEISSSTSAPIAPAPTLEETLAARAGSALPPVPVLPPVPAPEVIKPVKDAQGRWRHPNTGNWTGAPAEVPKAKSKPSKAQAQPKAAKDDGPPLDANGIPIKPDRVPSDDDPGMRKSGGGVFSHAMNLARKYAKGGAVVGAMVGPTGGRADKLPIDVPSGAYILPSDYVSGLPGAGSNTLAGMKILEHRFGPSHKMAAGGAATPIVISHGEFIVSPEQVARLGGGDLNAGHRRLDQEVMQARQNHINTLKSLPAPAR